MWKLFAAAALALSVIVSGCGPSSPEDEGGVAGAPGPEIALVMKSLANEFFKTMEEGAVAYHEEQGDGFRLITNGIKNEEDIGGQVALVEQMMARGVDALVIAPADSKALVPVLKRARRLGIQVVNIDNRLDEDVLDEADMRIPFVGPDNRAGARMAGEYLAKRLEPGDAVAIIGGIPSAFNAIQRRLGFEDAMTAAGMEIVASQSGNWEMSKANQVAAGIINEHPDIKAILCANDSMVLGAVAALHAAGRDDVLTVGFDNISAVQDLLKEGKVLCTVDQHGDQLAVYGIKYALELLNAGTHPVDQETPVDLITAESLQ